MPSEQNWLALAIGNSRLHWAAFQGERLASAWDTPHTIAVDDAWVSSFPELWIASVVPEQTAVWSKQPGSRVVTPEQVPLKGRYATLGVDRALALWGAIQMGKTPVLVIDGGTALTLTGADDSGHLVGGAILPGLRLQMRSLSQGTAALPPVGDLSVLPPRWALDTASAIRSGILHTVLAGLREFIEAWQRQFPQSAIVLTGGDGEVLYHHLRSRYPALTAQISIDPHLMFRGVQGVRSLSLSPDSLSPDS
jgi:type III pantothenate kinase